MDHEFTLVLIFMCPLLICTKFKGYQTRFSTKLVDKTPNHEEAKYTKDFSVGTQLIQASKFYV